MLFRGKYLVGVTNLVCDFCFFKPKQEIMNSKVYSVVKKKSPRNLGSIIICTRFIATIDISLETT